MKKGFLVIILISYIYSFNLLGSNTSFINESILRIKYRKDYIKHNNIDYLLKLSQNELEILIPELTKIKNKTIKEKRILLILKLLYYSKGVQAINNHDKQIISKYIKKYKIKIKLKDIRELFTKKNNKFLNKMLKVEVFLKKNNKSRMIKYQTYNYLGPYLEIYKTICKFSKKLTDKKIFINLKKNKKCNLKKNIFIKINTKKLLKLIEYGDKQIIGNYNIITPYIAKIILFEAILRRMDKKDKKVFFSKIINKTDYSEFTCGKFCNQKEFFIKRDSDLIEPHNGYQLLNSIKGANLIDYYSKIFLDNKKFMPLSYNSKLLTSGIECSLFLQRGIERSNIAQIKGRMKTDYMERALVNSKIATKYILNKEEQLRLGDIIKLKGHTYLFIGYKKLNNNYYGVTLEAVGGNLRSVGVFYRKFYDEKLGDFNKKYDYKMKIITLPYNEKYVIFRLK